jgi:predicted ATPase with chaperone activity
VYKTSIDPGDFLCELTTAGTEHARRAVENCTYCGSVPVPLADYIAGVEAQSICLQRPELADVQRALGDLSVTRQLVSRIAQAIRAGRGMFLYGAPGNGKTSVAERITRAFGQQIWIPRAISVDGEIIKLFDPCCHEELPLEAGSPPKFDARWIRIRRPTVVAGGELTMDRLEAQLNKVSGICEAPIQMKSNCGTLVIDDFGRQRMAISELLNRWIVPLEKRFDYINLPSGRAVQIPFDQLIVFSTNLEPRSLVDEAFLRRIPYKIDFADPSEVEFRALFDAAAAALGFAPNSEAVSYLIEKHYRAVKRPFRYCQPRDLLKQVRYYCEVHRLPSQLTPEAFDAAVANYFSVL